MKALFLAAAALAALTLSAGAARAQYPPPGYAPGGYPGDVYGGGYSGGHMMSHGGHMIGHVGGGFKDKVSGLFGGKLFSGIFCNHGSLFGKDDHGHGFGAGLGGFGAGGLGLGGLGAGLFGGGGQGGGTPIPVVDPRMGGNAGQLVFPQHPFWRSPRDYFMYYEQ